MGDAPEKSCFFICPIGDEGSPTRKRSDQVDRHLVRPAAVALGLEVTRADQVSDEGLISHQVIERLFDSDLVVADLTDRNPNVFYELAVRHAVRRPVVHLIEAGQDIPFDLKDVRAAQYELSDPDLLEASKDRVAKFMKAIVASEGPGANPVSSARDLQLLRQSGEPQVREQGEILTALSDLRQGMVAIHREIRTRATFAGPRHNLLSRVAVGDRVEHANFGAGTVVGTEPGALALVLFDGEKHPRKLMWDRAPLRLIDQSPTSPDEDDGDYRDEEPPEYEPDVDDVGD